MMHGSNERFRPTLLRKVVTGLAVLGVFILSGVVIL